MSPPTLSKKMSIPLGHSSFSRAANVLRLVVDRSVEAGLVGQPAAFLLPAGDADDAAALDLGDLPGDRAGRARRAGNDDGFACDRPAHVEQAEVGGDAGHPEHAHRQFERRSGGQLVELALGVHRDIVLPAGEAGHDVADRVVGIVRRHDPARAERANDLADLDRRQIRVQGDPTPLRRVAGQHQVAHQRLALAGSGDVGLDEIEVAVLDRSMRTAREQPLTVFHIGPLKRMERSS